MRRELWALILIPSLFLLSGCEATHVVYVYDATLGVDVSLSGSEGTQKLVLGYGRETFALVPTAKNPSRPKAADYPNGEWEGVREQIAADTQPAQGQKAGDRAPDAMNVTAISKVCARWLDSIEFNHLFATGRAAITLANDAEGLAQIRDAIFSDGSLCAGSDHTAQTVSTTATPVAPPAAITPSPSN